jgi:hypothetical protein
MKNTLWLFAFLLIITSCTEDEPTIGETGAKMNFQFKFDPTQERLNGFGEPSTIPSNHAAQNPDFNSMSGFYIELVPTKFTQIGEGAVVYEAPKQTAQPNAPYTEAVIFDDAIVSDENETFLTLDVKDMPVGTYEYLRISVTYQNMNIHFNMKNLPAPFPNDLDNQKGTLASFIGFNTYISDFTIKNRSVAINDDKQQGFWGFELDLDEPYQSYYLQYANPDGFSTGQSPAGATTVVNPLAAFGVTLPQGSCIVTGKLSEPLVITGNETEDIDITLSFSTNQSFEWVDDNGNGEWDWDIQTNTIEQVVDMGLRGLTVLVD